MFTLFSNTDGDFNTANGSQALYSNTTGTANTANGWQALFNNNSVYNTADGFRRSIPTPPANLTRDRCAALLRSITAKQRGQWL